MVWCMSLVFAGYYGSVLNENSIFDEISSIQPKVRRVHLEEAVHQVKFANLCAEHKTSATFFRLMLFCMIVGLMLPSD